MHKKTWFSLFFLIAVATSHAQDNKIGISHNKISTLVFDEEIVDVELGNQEYHVKVKGRYLLLRAKSPNINFTSLFVRYGKKKNHYYVTEIFPDNNAPLKYLIQKDCDSDVAKKRTEPEKEPFFSDNEQEYFDIGVIQNGVQVILNKILHTDNATGIQLFIRNTSSVDLFLEQYTFEYVTILSKGFFTVKKKHKLVEPMTEPSSCRVSARGDGYMEFSIPTYVSEGGLEVFLGESAGERGFRFLIPSKVLLKAKKK
jgi:hypothetical protein